MNGATSRGQPRGRGRRPGQRNGPAAPAVVVTGSTRGLGFALAEQLLERGCRVTVSGRTPGAVQEAAARLGSHGPRVQGVACDVADAVQVQALWEQAFQRWGRVDIWINNAGIPQDYLRAWELGAEEAARLLGTNLLGAIHGSRTAMRGMLAQGGGAIYNLEGWGSDGKRRRGLAVYGTSKCAVRYFTLALADEAAGTPVLVGTLSPGMMVTGFLTGPMGRMSEGESRSLRRIVNILGDRPQTVARHLAPRILANRRHRARLAWLTGARVMARFLTAGLRRRDLFA
jgi:NAD(P)-dependent dehydrogenase (short-subunit alcohol dehydrogenase family)